MDQYYLMAQLPSLDGLADNAAPPISEPDFLTLCQRHLGKKTVRQLSALTIAPSRSAKPIGEPFIDRWNDHERQLRLALGIARAEKMHKTFDPGSASLSHDAIRTAEAAVELGDPLSAERYLGRYRLNVLEAMRPSDPFSPHAVLYYGLKLKLLWRMRQFDENKGRDAYRRIYHATIQKERNGQDHE